MNIKSKPFNTYNVTIMITITTTIAITITITALPDWRIRILTGLRRFDNDYDLTNNLQIFFTWDKHGHEHGHVFTANPYDRRISNWVKMRNRRAEHEHEHVNKNEKRLFSCKIQLGHERPNERIRRFWRGLYNDFNW